MAECLVNPQRPFAGQTPCNSGQLRGTPWNSVQLRATPWKLRGTPWELRGTPWDLLAVHSNSVELRGLRGTPSAQANSVRPSNSVSTSSSKNPNCSFAQPNTSTLKLKRLFLGGAGTHTFLNVLRKPTTQQATQKAKYAASFSENKVRSKFLRKQSTQEVLPHNPFAIFGQQRQLCIKCTLHFIKSTFKLH